MASYIVNEGGATHSVDPATAHRMIEAGEAREATVEEIEAWYAEQGLVYDAESDVAEPPVAAEPVGEPATLRTAKDPALDAAAKDSAASS